MSILVVGLGHRGVPLGLLERMTIPADRVPKALEDLSQREFLSEAVVLSTCHRIEVYAVAERFHGGVQDIRNFLSEFNFVAPEEFTDHLVTYHDEAAVAHLFSVAAGLESVVRGESQILGQVRAGWERARGENACGPQLDALFRHALGTGKRARSETTIGQGVTSLSQAAVALASDRLGGLDGRRIAVLGAGEMGAGVVTVMSGAGAGGVGGGVSGVGGAGGVAGGRAGGAGPEVVVASRSRDRARMVADRVGARGIGLDQLDHALGDVDLLVTSTGSPSVVVTTAQMADVVDHRGGRPLLIIDMGMPRDVDGGVGRLDGVTLLDLADLRAFVDAGPDPRPDEVATVRAIVADEVDRFRDEAIQRRAVPTVTALRARAEELRQVELDRYRSRLSGLDARQQEAVVALTRGILGKLLHQPTVQLKEAAGSPRGERLSEAARELFGLEVREHDGAGRRGVVVRTLTSSASGTSGRTR
ncbi:MAG TPA: glutamyl-tRNA reductase [Acidimicrobiales bacterium]|nr:glutamyl-tRNA reductase [Acidimicrobiales bacterium]